MRDPGVLDIDDDIRVARTPPGSFYRDAAWFARQRASVLARSWHWSAALAGAREAGDAVPFTLLDDALVATRDGDALRVLSNACTHRGALVVGAPCRGATLRCPYHGRRFGLDGRCLGAPGFEADALAPLPRAAVTTWRGLPFASLDPARPLAEMLTDVAPALAALPVESLAFDPSGTRAFTLRAHWALYVENYLEGLHVPYVHPGLQAALSMRDYRTEVFEWSVLQVGEAREGDGRLLPPPPGRPDARVAAYYLWVFPHVMLNFYPWGLSVNVVVPEGLDRTRVEYGRYVWDPDAMGHGAGGDLDTVEQEDDAIVESVQRGVGGSLYARGRYAPEWERGVHAFHRMLARCL